MAYNNGFLDDSNFEDFSPDARRIKHPVVTFVHLFFRSLSLLVYLFCAWFSSSFISSFVLTVLLLSLDFWTVKNVTGRIMVGLRWWNYTNDQGESVWKFEARSAEDAVIKLSTTEVHIFWAGLICAPVFWVLFFLTALWSFKLKWLLLVIIGLSLSGANLLGYIRCRFGKTDSTANLLSGVAEQYLQKKMMDKVMGAFTSKPGPKFGDNMTV